MSWIENLREQERKRQEGQRQENSRSAEQQRISAQKAQEKRVKELANLIKSCTGRKIQIELSQLALINSIDNPGNYEYPETTRIFGTVDVDGVAFGIANTVGVSFKWGEKRWDYNRLVVFGKGDKWSEHRVVDPDPRSSHGFEGALRELGYLGNSSSSSGGSGVIGPGGRGPRPGRNDI